MSRLLPALLIAFSASVFSQAQKAPAPAYEPSVGQFRVRVSGENGIVVPDFRESWAIQAGGYVVKPRDLPLYRIDLCGPAAQDLCAASVPAGVTLQRRWLHVTPGLWSE